MTEVNIATIEISVTLMEPARNDAGPIRRRARRLAFWRDAEHYWHSDWLAWNWAPARP